MDEYQRTNSIVDPESIFKEVLYALGKGDSPLPDFENVEFQCLRDMELCSRFYNKIAIRCTMLFVLCIARQFIPFIGKKK